jgi:hypothetical protein
VVNLNAYWEFVAQTPRVVGMRGSQSPFARAAERRRVKVEGPAPGSPVQTSILASKRADRRVQELPVGSNRPNALSFGHGQPAPQQFLVYSRILCYRFHLAESVP